MYISKLFRVKNYKLWCNNSKSLGLIISKDVTFNESALLDSQKEKVIVESNYSVRKRVELEV